MTPNPAAVEALTEALRPYYGPSYFPGLYDVTIIAKTPEQAAETIIGALPEGWQLIRVTMQTRPTVMLDE